MDRVIMQRENERRRVVVDGWRTDDRSRCEVLAVQETSRDWCLYPHGAGALGVRLPSAQAERLAQAIGPGGAR